MNCFFGWLLEIQRITRPGGFAYLTFLDENSVNFGLQYPQRPVGRRIKKASDLFDDFLKGRNNMVVLNRGSRSMTFIRREYLLERLSRIFEVVGVAENTVAQHQTAVLLKVVE